MDGHLPQSMYGKRAHFERKVPKKDLVIGLNNEIEVSGWQEGSSFSILDDPERDKWPMSTF